MKRSSWCRVQRSVASLSVVLAILGGCTGRDATLSTEDVEAVRAADQAYATAWMANDQAQVMATFTEDPVIVPSGMEPLEGVAAIEGFWWPPDSRPTTITTFALTQDEVGGSGDLGFARGSFVLEFDYDGTHYSSGGRYLSLFERGVDGTWRISRRMWNDR